MQAIVRWLRRLRRDETGAIALMLALSLIPLSIAALGAVDLANALNTRAKLQDALDAAALAGARLAPATHSPPSADDEASLESVGEANFTQNLASPLAAEVDSKSFQFSDADQSVVIANATAHVSTLLAQLVLGGRPLEVSAHSEVRASSSNVELSLVLDVTGSMSRDGKLDALKAAATDLLNMVVKDQQTPYYSKAALIPYSQGVNVGALADAVRGKPKSYCTSYGCGSYQFTTAAPDPYTGSTTKTYPLTNCVTERVSAFQYTDDPVTKALVGRQYATGGCPNTAVMPLTSDRQSLINAINGLSASGSTAGQVGVAWGWYMLSPNFLTTASGLPSSSLPAAYGSQHLLKVMVLMTDGMFNTSYYNGVVSDDTWDHQTGSGDAWTHINRNATNGSPFDQAKTLCANMKAKGVIIYTVGFFTDFATVPAADQATAKDVMNSCASSPANVYLPGNGTDLKTAFHAIAQDIDNLRLTK